jgi:hypothetical protein
MLSGIKLVSKEEAERLEEEDRKNQKKEHKHKHKRKHKKEKKGRTHDRNSGDDSFSSDKEGDDRPERGKAPDQFKDAVGYGDQQQQQQPPSSSLQREDWMSVPMARTTVDPLNDQEKKTPAEDPDEPKVSARELNPDLRKHADGGGTAAPANGLSQQPGIGDGGASWRMKALRRAQSQAGEEGKVLSDVVAERWGSLGNLTAELAQGTAAHGMAHAQAARERRREGGKDTRDGGTSSRHMSDVRSTKSQMRRPSQQNLEKMSWRREGQETQGDKSERDKRTTHQQQRSSDTNDTREQSYRYEGEREREMQMARGGTANERQRQGGERTQRTRQQSTEGDNNNNTMKKNDGDTVEAVLRAAAPELNTFRNDGSFLEKCSTDGGRSQEREKVRRPAIMEHEDQREDLEAQQRPYSRSEEEEEKREIEGEKEDASVAADRPPVANSKSNNLSAAAMLRARLSGKQHAASSAVRQGQEKQKLGKQEETTTIMLPLIDASGRAAPGAFGRESASTAAGADASTRPIKKVERYDQDGQRKRYFADDDTIDLDTLVKRTKYGTTEDIDVVMARNIAKSSTFKTTDLDADAEYDWDAGLDLADGRHRASKDARRQGSATEEIVKKEKQRQIREYNKFQSALDRCALCFTSKLRQKHLTLAIGTVAYLALPSRGRLVPGHCQIVPAEHIASTRSTDESTWTEIRNFKKCVLQMFTAQGMDVIFIETALGIGGGGTFGGQDARAHAVVDCIPVPQDVFSKSPMYFRKAVDDITSEWAQHAAKRMIDTSKKGLRGSIPQNFPYFHVEFGLGSGFVHVIDNPAEFPRDFGRGVMVGLLRLPEEDMHRRAKKESEKLQMQWAAEFRNQFDEFDWTKQL